MHLGLRLFFGFFFIAGLAAFFVLRVFIAEVKPSVREVMEDILIDSANLLAEQAAVDMAAMPSGESLQGSRFANAVEAYAKRTIDAKIWGLDKQQLDFRVYVTDAAGKVVFDSGLPSAVGQDYSRWRDVALTLRGEYGARSSRTRQADDSTSVMHVAAPVVVTGKVLGVVTVAKPLVTVQKFIERAERKILVAGLWLFGLSIAVGIAVTWWAVRSVRQLRHYAHQARAGDHHPPPKLPGELGDLAQAMGAMRDRLEGRHEVEQAMRALTHELKSPLTAIGGAAELLSEPLAPEDRTRFADQVQQQVHRLRGLVDRLLELSKLESLGPPEALRPVSLSALALAVCADFSPTLQQHGLSLAWLQADDVAVLADEEHLRLALSNLLSNAVAAAPDGTALELSVVAQGDQGVFSLRDHGFGVPAYAWPQLGQRFFSLPSHRTGQKGSGLGLAIVRQVVARYGGRLTFEDARPGLRAQLQLPLA